MAQQKYWFPAKRHGIGWGPPLTWQGWVVLMLHLAIVTASAVTLPQSGNIALFVAIVFLSTAVLVAVCWWKGEKINWRWGDRR
ncbi:MAG: hypothetical protein AAF889_02710 [Cyanobacteria bacterium P01_D01_bin.73]